MGTQRLSKTNRLFWLGRYAERTFTVVEHMQQAYDAALDGPGFDYADWCMRLEIPNNYTDIENFLSQYIFSQRNPDSAASSLNLAFDNAVVLRDTITSTTLSYVQLAKNVMDNARTSAAPMLDLQLVRDYLMAFKGCVDEFIADEDSRMIVKCGFTVERIDLLLRLDWRTNELDKEFARLASRLRRTHMARDAKRLRLLVDLVPCPNPAQNKDILLDCVENLFPDA